MKEVAGEDAPADRSAAEQRQQRIDSSRYRQINALPLVRATCQSSPVGSTAAGDRRAIEKISDSARQEWTEVDGACSVLRRKPAAQSHKSAEVVRRIDVTMAAIMCPGRSAVRHRIARSGGMQPGLTFPHRASGVGRAPP